jgi:hypothetical protein
MFVGNNLESKPENWKGIATHCDRLISAIAQDGLDVSAEHTMFASKDKLDVLPRLLIRAHDTVKYWAAELMTRVQEYIGYYLSRHAQSKGFKGATMRPFTANELRLWWRSLKDERDTQAGRDRQKIESVE